MQDGAGAVWRCPPDVVHQEVAAVAVASGDALVIPTGWELQFQAVADADAALRFLYVTMPPWLGMGETEAMPDGGLGEPTLPPDGRH